MSKFLPDPQNQQLRAMRRGDIALADGGVKTIGVQPIAFAQPLVTKSIVVPAAVESLVALSGMPTEAPIVSRAIQTFLSFNANISINLTTTNALEPLSGTPSEAPTIGVAFTTTVI